MSDQPAPTSSTPSPTRTTLLAIDLPNINCQLHNLAGGVRGAAVRLGFQGLVDHLLAECGDTSAPLGTVFMQLPDRTPGNTGFIMRIRQLGFGVHPRPVGDIDDNLVAHVAELAPSLEHLLLITHDRGLIERCLAAVTTDCRMSILGLEEYSAMAMRHERLRFVDLGDVAGVLSPELPRRTIGHLPDEGRLLPPLRPLRASTAPSVRAA